VGNKPDPQDSNNAFSNKLNYGVLAAFFPPQVLEEKADWGKKLKRLRHSRLTTDPALKKTLSQPKKWHHTEGGQGEMNPTENSKISKDCTGSWLLHFCFSLAWAWRQRNLPSSTWCLSSLTPGDGLEPDFRLRGTEPGQSRWKSSLLSTVLMTNSLQKIDLEVKFKLEKIVAS